MSLGGIFNGAVITEKVFGYPGVGSLLVDAVYAGDYGLVLGVTTISILGVSVGVLAIDLLYPLLDPQGEGELMLADPARPACATTSNSGSGSRWSRSCCCCRPVASFSPYPPQDVYVVPPDVPPSLTYWFGTTSRGQDVFWQLSFAIRNTLLFGMHRGADQPAPGARDRACQRLQGRLDRPRADVGERHLHRHPAAARSWCCSIS